MGLVFLLPPLPGKLALGFLPRGPFSVLLECLLGMAASFPQKARPGEVTGVCI